jgi:DNA repair protein RecO (recombination protein O)
MSEREHAQLEHGFVLHQRAYRNTSQLLDCLTLGHGRVALVAQGSRRARSGQRALLQPFAPLRLSWLRRGELGRLTGVEADSPSHALTGQHLFAGFYINELLLRLTARGDPNADVFSCYSDCLAHLAAQANVSRTLRLFELHLLTALGYGLELNRDADTGELLQPDRRYVFEVERGPRVSGSTVAAEPDAEPYWGRDLISLREESLDSAESLRAAQRLLGRTLKSYLGEKPLKTRLVLRDIIDRGL